MSVVKGMRFKPISGLCENSKDQTMEVLNRSDCRILETLLRKANLDGPWSKLGYALGVKHESSAMPPQHLVLCANLLDDLPGHYPAAVGATLDVVAAMGGRVLWPAVILRDKRILAVVCWGWLVDYLNREHKSLVRSEIEEIGPARLMDDPLIASLLPHADCYIFFDYFAGEGVLSMDYTDVDYELTDVVIPVNLGPDSRVVVGPEFGEELSGPVHAISCCLSTWDACPPEEKIAK